MDINDPFGIRRDFNAVLDRLEIAVTGYDPDYAFMENQADLAVTAQFMQIVWPTLTNAEQRVYANRLAYLKRKGRGQTT